MNQQESLRVEPSRRRLPAGRKADLVAHVDDVKQVTVSELSERFNVSIDTIRRDLDQLDADGLVVRTHGGAVSVHTVPRTDRAIDERLRLQSREKETIGRLAAHLIGDGAVIMINAGTTALAVARALHDHRDLTVATNNLLLASEIAPDAVRDIYVFGGAVRTVTQSTTGPVLLRLTTGDQAIDLSCDIALIGVGAVSASDGYTTSNAGEAAMMHEMMRRANTVVVLADSSKFDRRLFAQVAPLEIADYLVTDQLPTGELAEALDLAGVTVVAPESTSRP
ncbi:MAG: DeoR/GlpR transcriptional regulator [Microcella sp.]|uniref:DeoR/GlpR family DNA-binding transcription regulator n=1 Tax=Microcella sp. TaxID=1913979 RepID=UPI0024C53A97|nr:DeoR/GlpR family DNA-binding transcription regulator [Microcella sp.]UYN83538.1 MAG: DeoR/GlpR transcriptional regulator [Microcella sp.]